MSFDMERICNIVFLTKIEHSPTVKPEHVYNVPVAIIVGTLYNRSLWLPR